MLVETEGLFDGADNGSNAVIRLAIIPCLVQIDHELLEREFRHRYDGDKDYHSKGKRFGVSAG